PRGCWPSEGGVSDAVLPLLAEYGFSWFASGQGVLNNSLLRAGGGIHDASWPYRIYRLRGLPLHGFFRDDDLSDAIGFNYSDWHGEDAVADFVNRLTDIASRLESPQDHVVPIIMDGENAWEHYPDNGYYFLDHLYQALSDHPLIRTTTFGDLAADSSLHSVELQGLCAGSWVYGSFSTWIGDSDKNRAWGILVGCKRAFDAVVADHCLAPEDIRRLEQQLAVCEGSDWFWWFGDYNPVESISDFSELFRLHISNLYAMMGRPVPDEVHASFGTGGDVEHGGAMRRGREG
ncbi:glycoside hydrolase, partial [Pseudomonadota bacterium]